MHHSYFILEVPSRNVARARLQNGSPMMAMTWGSASCSAIAAQLVTPLIDVVEVAVRELRRALAGRLGRVHFHRVRDVERIHVGEARAYKGVEVAWALAESYGAASIKAGLDRFLSRRRERKRHDSGAEN